jgi:hypothetical protein
MVLVAVNAGKMSVPFPQTCNNLISRMEKKISRDCVIKMIVRLPLNNEDYMRKV